jgi:endonuclease/exonuclease/phosphatase family metal-dependent hydrolase
MRLINILFVIFFIIFNCEKIYANPERKIIVGFYNCENLFDTYDDPAKEDEEFTPNGKYHYTQSIYEKKLHNIAAVLERMEPAILGLAEIENNTVLNALTRQPAIAGRKYKYVWYSGPDPRGINVALVYDPALFRVLTSEPIHVDISATGGKSVTRDVLHVRGILVTDTVDVFVNHWPSRRGGADESVAKREIAARVNRDAAKALLKKNRNAHIIIMGDLNDNPDDNSVHNVLAAKTDKATVSAADLYNPYAAIYNNGGGTEVYRRHWNLFDQVIISGSLLYSKTLKFDRAEIFKPSFIVDTYKGHEGEPHRSFKGTYWINGYSDHFPVVTYFTTSNAR